MMRAMIVAFLVLNLAACGHRGNLKSPEQIEAEAAKKAKKAEEAQ